MVTSLHLTLTSPHLTLPYLFPLFPYLLPPLPSHLLPYLTSYPTPYLSPLTSPHLTLTSYILPHLTSLQETDGRGHLVVSRHSSDRSRHCVLRFDSFLFLLVPRCEYSVLGASFRAQVSFYIIEIVPAVAENRPHARTLLQLAPHRVIHIQPNLLLLACRWSRVASNTRKVRSRALLTTRNAALIDEN